MDTNNNNKDAIFLQAMHIFEKAMDKYYRLEFKDGIRLLSINDTSKIIGCLNKKSIKQLYKEGKLKGILKNEKLYLFSDSVQDYVLSLKSITHNEHFMNEQNIMKKAKVTRSEYDKIVNN